MCLPKMASESRTSLKEREILIKVSHSSVFEYNVSRDDKMEDFLESGTTTVFCLWVCDFLLFIRLLARKTLRIKTAYIIL